MVTMLTKWPPSRPLGVDYVVAFAPLQLKDAIHMVGSRQYWKQALNFLDAKLLLIPVVFILVRIWTCVFSFMFVYMQVPLDQVPEDFYRALVYLTVGEALSCLG